MKKDAHRTLHCDSHIPTTDVTRIDKGDEEIWQLGDVLRG